MIRLLFSILFLTMVIILILSRVFGIKVYNATEKIYKYYLKDDVKVEGEEERKEKCITKRK